MNGELLGAGSGRLPRLPSGQHGLTPQTVLDSQRSRLQLAMVNCVSEVGYANTKIRDLARAAGVSPNAFYKVYSNKEQCFLDTHDAITLIEIDRVRRAGSEGQEWETRLRGAIEALMETVVQAPTAAYLAIVEIHAVGTGALEHQQRALAAHERLMREILDEAPHGENVTDTTVKAIVAGVRGAIYHQLEIGDVPALRSLVGPVNAWVLSYHSSTGPALGEPFEGKPPVPASPPARRSSRTGASEATRAPGHRERIMRAVADLSCDVGYAGLRVPAITARAGVSNQTFYEHFSNKHDAFLACYDRVSRRALAAVLTSFQAAPSWPDAVGASLRRLLEFVAAEPEFARLGLFEVLAAGVDARRRAQARTEAFTAILTPGSPSRAVASPRVLAGLVAGGTWGVIQHHVISGRTERLPELAPQLTYMALAPFVGVAEAARVAADVNAE